MFDQGRSMAEDIKARLQKVSKELRSICESAESSQALPPLVRDKLLEANMLIGKATVGIATINSILRHLVGSVVELLGGGGETGRVRLTNAILLDSKVPEQYLSQLSTEGMKQIDFLMTILGEIDEIKMSIMEASADVRIATKTAFQKDILLFETQALKIDGALQSAAQALEHADVDVTYCCCYTYKRPYADAAYMLRLQRDVRGIIEVLDKTFATLALDSSCPSYMGAVLFPLLDDFDQVSTASSLPEYVDALGRLKEETRYLLLMLGPVRVDSSRGTRKGHR